MDEAGLLTRLRARAQGYPQDWPATRVGYGPGPDQFGILRAPAAGAGRLPVAVLVHGGYWRSRWRLDLMDALAADLESRGVASWNIEYRRAEDAGWEAMTADVHGAIRHLAALADRFPIDPGAVAFVGHSAGGQLALRAARDLVAEVGAPRPAVVVSLAGIVDLVGADRRNLGNGAARAALGATAAQQPGRYARSSPRALLPIGVPQVIVTADGDDPDLNDLHRGYAAAAAAAGDRIVSVEVPGDHFDLIDPASDIWRATFDRLAACLATATG